MSRVIGVNGIRTDGSGSTDRLLDGLADSGLNTLDFNYDRVNLFTARSRRRQRQIGFALLDDHQPGDHVVAHSYGALVVLRAMEAGARFGLVFLFSPAMDSRQYFPYHGAHRLHIISNAADRVIGLGSLLWRHDFGRMGSDGYQGPPDDRVLTFPTLDWSDDHGPFHHSDFFMGATLNGWVQYVARHIRGAENG